MAWSKAQREKHSKTMKAVWNKKGGGNVRTEITIKTPTKYESATLESMQQELTELPELVRKGWISAADAEDYVRRLRLVPRRNR